MKIRKPVTLLLLAAFCAAGAAPASAAQNGELSPAVLSTNDRAEGGITDPEEYHAPEIYIQYADGTDELRVLTDHSDLEDALSSLSADPAVLWFQPNYSYTSTAEILDPYYSEQWALSNDGSFQMEDEYDGFPFFTDPFEDPWWGMEDDFWNSFPWMEDFFRDIGFSRWYGRTDSSNSSSQSQAVEGIDINMEDAWEVYDGGSREVIVAVIDTGIDYTHEDLADTMWMNSDEIAGDGIDNDGNGYVDDIYGWNFYDDNNQVYTGSEDSHGTHCAGTIAASRNSLGIAGIAGNSTVRVMSLKALGGSEGYGSTASIVEAIRYAQANGAVICNLSFGTSTNDPALRNAIVSSDMLFIAAAGNGSGLFGGLSGQDTDRSPIYPAAYDLDQIISVANLQYDGTLHESSNYGASSVDLAAPGTWILSTIPEDEYGYMTGTSMAAPMVTGAAALIYSYYEDMTLPELKDRILSSVRHLDSLDGLVATAGMLDVYAALTGDFDALTEVDPDSLPDASDTDSQEGTPPSISVSSSQGWHYNYLIVTVTDPEDDLSAVRYASGIREASDFEGGLYGTPVTLGSDHQAVFRITRRGTYTFYAVDSAGNESVLTVYIR